MIAKTIGLVFGIAVAVVVAWCAVDMIRRGRTFEGVALLVAGACWAMARPDLPWYDRPTR